MVTWEQYKEEYELEGPQLIRQLYACCSVEMKTSLSRITSGQQFKKTEKELLELMRQLAVRYQNPMVHVQEFLCQTQNQDEGVRSFLTRLRGVAARCNFSEKCQDCNKAICYSDSIIRFKLIAGLADPEIKEDILSLEEKSLDELLKRRKVVNWPDKHLVQHQAQAKCRILTKQTPGLCSFQILSHLSHIKFIVNTAPIVEKLDILHKGKTEKRTARLGIRPANRVTVKDTSKMYVK